MFVECVRVRMCVCMYVCTYVCMYVCMHVCLIETNIILYLMKNAVRLQL
jgi:hypothetical protein